MCLYIHCIFCLFAHVMILAFLLSVSRFCVWSLPYHWCWYCITNTLVRKIQITNALGAPSSKPGSPIFISGLNPSWAKVNLCSESGRTPLMLTSSMVWNGSLDNQIHQNRASLRPDTHRWPPTVFQDVDMFGEYWEIDHRTIGDLEHRIWFLFLLEGVHVVPACRQNLKQQCLVDHTAHDLFQSTGNMLTYVGGTWAWMVNIFHEEEYGLLMFANMGIHAPNYMKLIVIRYLPVQPDLSLGTDWLFDVFWPRRAVCIELMFSLSSRPSQPCLPPHTFHWHEMMFMFFFSGGPSAIMHLCKENWATPFQCFEMDKSGLRRHQSNHALSKLGSLLSWTFDRRTSGCCTPKTKFAPQVAVTYQVFDNHVSFFTEVSGGQCFAQHRAASGGADRSSGDGRLNWRVKLVGQTKRLSLAMTTLDPWGLRSLFTRLSHWCLFGFT